MRKMIRADLRRVLGKPSFYIINVLTLIAFTFFTKGQTASEMVASVKEYIHGIVLFSAGITAFMGIYSDEIKSGFVINLIGSGYSRRKVIIAKLIDAAILISSVFSVAYIICLIKNMTAGLGISPKQNLFLLIYFLYCLILGIGFFALASLVVFVFWSASFGMIILLFEIVLSKIILNAIQEKFTIPIFDISFEGLLNSSYAAFSAGNFGWQIIPAVLIYICGIVFLAVVLFKRRELYL